MLAGLITLDIRELHHLSGLEVDNSQRILGHFVGLFLGNLGPPRNLEIGLDLAHRVGVVLQYGSLVAARNLNGAVLLFAGYANVQRSVAFLRIHFIGDYFSRRGNGGIGHSLPPVEYSVVQRLFLCLKGNTYNE